MIDTSFLRLCFCALVVCLIATAGCGGPTSSTGPSADPSAATGYDDSPLFDDVTSELGVDFVLDVGDDENRYFMPRIVGSGVAFLDFDGDGRLDLYFLQNGGVKSDTPSRLYRQGEDGKFVDVGAGSGLDVPASGMGVAVGDVDNDGKVDVFISEYGRVRLFANRTVGHEPKFADITQDAGIRNVFWGTSCCFVDYDRDGWLDLVLVNYIDYDPSRWCADGSGRHDFCGPDNFAGRVTKLYRNLTGESQDSEDGDSTKRAIRFEDVTAEAGLAAHPGPGLGVFCADFNADRWPDIFVANDGRPNHLWINQRDGTFKEEALLSGIATNAMGKAEANMGIAIGDVDGNGLFDIFVTHLTTETHTLWVQEPRGMFQDQTVASGVTTAWRGTGFGTVMADFNNDGLVDLSIVNGKVERGTGDALSAPKLDKFWAPYAERNQVFVSDQKGGFRDVSEQNPAFSSEPGISRGLACADFDNDGGLDLVVTRVGAPASLYRNVAQRRGHWLMVRAVDPALNRDAYGAEIHLRAGQLKRLGWINPGYSYLCSNDPRAHFGLGAADRYDAITVIWPDGVEESFSGGDADRQVELRRGEGKLVEPPPG